MNSSQLHQAHLTVGIVKTHLTVGHTRALGLPLIVSALSLRPWQ
jgi:hypothetical protein